jgi:uncharacterized protein (TIGR00730 family)
VYRRPEDGWWASRWTFLAAKARAGADEMVIAGDLAERKRLLLEKADAVVIMVGGTGTLDEATEILELKKHGHTDKPVVLLNTAGFYDGLKEQFRRMEDEGFLPVPLTDLVFFAEEPVGALAYLEESGARSDRGGGGTGAMRAWRAWLHM